MSHSYYSLMIHAIWGTKNRDKILNINIRSQVLDIVKSVFEEQESPIIIANSTLDHLHIFYHQNSNISVAEVIKKVKGKSSRMINQSKIFKSHFQWQEGYGAFSVSFSQKDKVANYIKNQEIHHKTMSFDEEFINFTKANELINSVLKKHS